MSSFEQSSLVTPNGAFNLLTLEIDTDSKVNENSMSTSSRYLSEEDYIEPKEFINLINKIASSFSSPFMRDRFDERIKSFNFDKVLVPLISVFLGKENQNRVYFTIAEKDNLYRILLNVIVKILGSYASPIRKREICKLKGKKVTSKESIIAGRNKRLLYCTMVDNKDTLDGDFINDLMSGKIVSEQSDLLDFNTNLIICSTTNNKVFTREGQIPLEVIPGKVFPNNWEDIDQKDLEIFNEPEYLDQIFTYICKTLNEKCIGSDTSVNENIYFQPVKLFWENTVEILPANHRNHNHPIITVDKLYRKHFLPFIEMLSYKREITKDEFSRETSLIRFNRGKVYYHRSTKTKPAGYSGIKPKSFGTGSFGIKFTNRSSQ